MAGQRLLVRFEAVEAEVADNIVTAAGAAGVPGIAAVVGTAVAEIEEETLGLLAAAGFVGIEAAAVEVVAAAAAEVVVAAAVEVVVVAAAVKLEVGPFLRQQVEK